MYAILKILLTIVCAFFAASALNDRLFYLLEKFKINFEKKQKRDCLWAIFLTLLSLTGYLFVVYLLLLL